MWVAGKRRIWQGHDVRPQRRADHIVDVVLHVLAIGFPCSAISHRCDQIVRIDVVFLGVLLDGLNRCLAAVQRLGVAQVRNARILRGDEPSDVLSVFLGHSLGGRGVQEAVLSTSTIQRR